MIGDGLSYLTNTPFFLEVVPHFITPRPLSHTPHTGHSSHTPAASWLQKRLDQCDVRLVGDTRGEQGGGC